MADRRFLVNIDLKGNQLLNAVLQNATSDPSIGNGGIYYDSTTYALKYNRNGTWVTLATGGSAAQTVTLQGAIQGTGTVNGSGVITIQTNVTADAVVLGTNTSGDYVATIGGTDGVSVTGAGTEGRAVTIANTDKGSSQNIYKNMTDGTNTASAASNSDTFKFRGIQGVTVAVTNNDVTHGDNLLIGLTSVPNSSLQNSSVTVTAGTGLSGGGSVSLGGSVTLTNAGVTGLQGTANQITVQGVTTGPQTGSLVIGLPTDVSISGNMTVGGNLNVTGDINSTSTNNLLVEDNTITLNSNVTGVPTLNAGIYIERGDYTNAFLYWNETTNKWTVDTPPDSAGAVTTTALSLEGHTHTSANITDFTEAVQDVVGNSNYTKGSNSLSVTYDDNANTLTFDTTLAASNSYLTKTSGLAVDKSTLESALVTDGFTKKYSVNNGALTPTGGVVTWTVTHSLNTKDVLVQVYEVGTPYGQVEVEVNHTGVNTVDLKWNSAASVNADTYRVVVIG